MNTRLAIAALVAALAMTACDESANKPKAAAPTGGGIAGPKSANAAPANTPASKPDATRGDVSKPAQNAPASKPAGPAPATEPKATPPATTPPAAAAPKPQAPAEAPKDGVLKHTETDSGLIIDDLKFGQGVEAKAHQRVTIHYRGTLPDGTEFDSSYKSGKPTTFSLDDLVKGWQEGIPGMKVGGKRRLIVPPDLGYGKREIKGPNGQVLIPANSMLIFEIELFGVE